MPDQVKKYRLCSCGHHRCDHIKGFGGRKNGKPYVSATACSCCNCVRYTMSVFAGGQR